MFIILFCTFFLFSKKNVIKRLIFHLVVYDFMTSTFTSNQYFSVESPFFFYDEHSSTFKKIEKTQKDLSYRYYMFVSLDIDFLFFVIS